MKHRDSILVERKDPVEVDVGDQEEPRSDEGIFTQKLATGGGKDYVEMEVEGQEEPSSVDGH